MENAIIRGTNGGSAKGLMPVPLCPLGCRGGLGSFAITSIFIVDFVSFEKWIVIELTARREFEVRRAKKCLSARKRINCITILV